MREAEILFRRYEALLRSDSRDIPYFSADEVQQILFYADEWYPVPLTWGIWEDGSGATSIDKFTSSTRDDRSTNGETEVYYKNRMNGFKVLSVAQAVSTVYEVWFWDDLDDAAMAYGSRTHKDGSKAWWVVAFELMEKKPELRAKHFPDM